jgi:predicted  nucleic acid-binding Zn-ribbon protein
MNQILKRTLSFRFYSYSLANNLRVRKMSNVEELRQRSAQADELIKKLKTQIEQIKAQTTDAQKSQRVAQLQKENQDLKKRVDELKNQLEAAEAGRPAGKSYGYSI